MVWLCWTLSKPSQVLQVLKRQRGYQDLFSTFAQGDRGRPLILAIFCSFFQFCVWNHPSILLIKHTWMRRKVKRMVGKTGCFQRENVLLELHTNNMIISHQRISKHSQVKPYIPPALQGGHGDLPILVLQKQLLRGCHLLPRTSGWAMIRIRWEAGLYPAPHCPVWCNGADTPGTGTADFIWLIHFASPLQKEAKTRWGFCAYDCSEHCESSRDRDSQR